MVSQGAALRMSCHTTYAELSQGRPLEASRLQNGPQSAPSKHTVQLDKRGRTRSCLLTCSAASAAARRSQSSKAAASAAAAAAQALRTSAACRTDMVRRPQQHGALTVSGRASVPLPAPGSPHGRLCRSPFKLTLDRLGRCACASFAMRRSWTERGFACRERQAG